ncbi:MAG: DUF4136 domain-containing protein [Candidatus Atribacteria bacterium]|nr:DUF4136 domain-containing protein [Candidatus Atribacteria bacterium]
MRQWLLVLVALVVVSVFTAPSMAKTYISDLCVNPEVDFKSFRRFVLYEGEKEGAEAIFLKEILQGIKETLIRKGYEYGGNTANRENNTADFVVSVAFSIHEEEIYIPPKTVLIPQFNPGRIYSTSGSIHSYLSGDWYHFDMTTTESGQWTTVPVTRPGRYETFQVPEVFIQVYSHRSEKPVLLFEGKAYKLIKRMKKPQESLKSAAKDLMEEFPTKKVKTEPSRKKKK